MQPRPRLCTYSTAFLHVTAHYDIAKCSKKNRRKKTDKRDERGKRRIGQTQCSDAESSELVEEADWDMEARCEAAMERTFVSPGAFCTNRALWPMTARAFCHVSRLTVMLSVATFQLTPSEQGGVVREPE